MNLRPKILVVDDDHESLDLLEMILYRDYEVITAMNGFEALKKVEEEAPELIITDIMMPVMNGIRFFNSLRKNPGTHSVPMVALTSFSKEYPVKSLVNMGFSGVIAKPPDSATVLELIGKLLSGSEPEKEPDGNEQAVS